ncbi:MAG: MotA/TolQ/ExbB proton channel family protein [Candidatus Omnitrophica bacterium]|nr:MotA/TolQ/ExbB proton channel family protein [Candidatus Omnitrophota bacterium]
MHSLFIKGGFLMWPIALCSIVSLTIILERFYYFNKTRAKSKNLSERVHLLLKNNKAEEAISAADADKSFLGRFLCVGIKVMNQAVEEKQKILRRAGSRELEQADTRLRVLSVIGNISTLLGLLGTVTGMIQTFMKIEKIGGIAEVAVLAGGIWEALLTTAAGLSVAIPTLVFYHYFEGIVDNRAIQMKNIASDIFNIH